jgi:hypothetical protein
MDHQTSLNGSTGSARDLKAHLGDMVRDVARIAELQVQLLSAQLHQSRERIVRGAICWAAALVLFAALLPPAIAGCGLWLADATELTPAGGILCAVGSVAIVVAVLARVGWTHFQGQLAMWEDSQRELRENLAALRDVFSRHATHESTESYAD